MKPRRGTWSATWPQGGAGVRRLASPRRSARRVGWLLAFGLAASFCLPVLADEGARVGDGLPTGVEEGPCPGLWDGGGTTPSFGLGGSVFGSGSERPGRPQQPSPRRFSLCPDLVTMDTLEGPGFSRAPLAPLVQTATDPRAPLRGVRNATAPFGKKFVRGVLIITGTEIASGFILALMPKQNTNWDGNPLSRAGSNFGRAYTTLPVWDGDIYFHNWIGHPYAGAFYYNMIRSQGGTIGQSFAFSAFQSVMWEYVLESWAEQPSIQDLISTPLIGAVVGELFHRWSMAIIKKGKLNFGQKALVFFLNPSYVINNGYRPPE
jgi:Domain of unknown function (DUF3943)